jgi:ABC-type transport system involved in multi-copper enzyme maturation permease subunit
MSNLIRSEIRKLATVRWFRITVAVTIVMASTFTLIAVFVGKREPDIDDSTYVHGVLSISAVSSLVLLGVGITSMAGEFRHGTSLPTFLVAPRRREVVLAKLITIAGVGAVLGAVTFGLAAATAIPALGHKGIHHLTADLPQMWIGAVMATALFGALGVALGTITRNMVVAIVAAVGWSYLVEGLILSKAFPGASRWLPVGANMAVTRTGVSADLLQPWAGLIVLVAWVAGAAGLAVSFIRRRDI